MSRPALVNRTEDGPEAPARVAVSGGGGGGILSSRCRSVGLCRQAVTAPASQRLSGPFAGSPELQGTPLSPIPRAEGHEAIAAPVDSSVHGAEDRLDRLPRLDVFVSSLTVEELTALFAEARIQLAAGALRKGAALTSRILPSSTLRGACRCLGQRS